MGTDSQQARNKTKYINNASGITGVSWIDKQHHKNSNEFTRYAIAKWNQADGKILTRSFSVKKFGEELAFFLACEKRELEIMKLNLILGDEGYSLNHGK